MSEPTPAEQYHIGIIDIDKEIKVDPELWDRIKQIVYTIVNSPGGYGVMTLQIINRSEVILRMEVSDKMKLLQVNIVE